MGLIGLLLATDGEVMYLFSKTTNGFYSKKLKYKDLPSDCVNVTEEEHSSLMKLQSEGNEITSDGKGNPIAVKTQEEQFDRKNLENMFVNKLNNFCKQKGYDNYKSVLLWAGFENQWRIEASEMAKKIEKSFQDFFSLVNDPNINTFAVLDLDAIFNSNWS